MSTNAKTIETPDYTVSFDLERERCFVEYHHEMASTDEDELNKLCVAAFGGPVKVEFIDVGEKGEEVFSVTTEETEDDLFEVVVNHVMVVNRIPFRNLNDALAAALAISKGDVKNVEVYVGNTEDGIHYKAGPIETFVGA